MLMGIKRYIYIYIYIYKERESERERGRGRGREIGDQLISTRKEVLIVMQNVIFYLFLHLLTSQRLRARFKISLRNLEDNI